MTKQFNKTEFIETHLAQNWEFVYEDLDKVIISKGNEILCVTSTGIEHIPIDNEIDNMLHELLEGV